jgi:putative DNA primase/helicase
VVSTVRGDGNENTTVRRALQPLVDLAEQTGCAVLGVSHYAKGSAGRDPIERVIGSIAFSAVARLVIAAAVITEEDGTKRHIIARAKTNIGPQGGGFAFGIELAEAAPGVKATRIVWRGPLEGTAAELLARADVPAAVAERGVTDEAVAWLRDLLQNEGGELLSRSVMKAAKEAGFSSERAIHRAREKLGVTIKASGFARNRRSLWRLPEPPIPAISAIPAKLEEQANMANMEEQRKGGGTC